MTISGTERTGPKIDVRCERGAEVRNSCLHWGCLKQLEQFTANLLRFAGINIVCSGEIVVVVLIPTSPVRPGSLGAREQTNLCLLP